MSNNFTDTLPVESMRWVARFLSISWALRGTRSLGRSLSTSDSAWVTQNSGSNFWKGLRALIRISRRPLRLRAPIFSLPQG